MKILCTGDLHLGRRSTGLPPVLADRTYTAADVWLALVDLALAEGVDLVALSGDVVDFENRFFEAYGPLERGLRRLATAGIETVAVAGNHDFGVLPRLADEIGDSRFRVLGRGGRWERWTLRRDGVARLHVDGWSFPARHHAGDPLADRPRRPDDGVPVLGLLHADLDATASPYAPVRLADLLATPVAAWVLGHIHAPGLRGGEAVLAAGGHPGAGRGRPPVLYPGSPLALHPGETGIHGPWLLRLESGRAVSVAQIPLSPVRYETLRVDVTGAGDVAGVDSAAAGAIGSVLESAAAESAGTLRALALRVVIGGRTPLYRGLASRLQDLRDLSRSHAEAVVGVERVEVEVRPAVDLEALARGADPPGILARVLLAIENGERTEDLERLLAAARRRADRVASDRTFAELRPIDPDAVGAADAGDDPRGEAALTAVVGRQAWALLDGLLAQREAS